MATQRTEYKCASCGTVFADADALAKHNNLLHKGGKQDTAKGVQDASWQSPASTTPKA